MAKYEVKSVSGDVVVINDVDTWVCASEGLKFKNASGGVIAWFYTFEYFVRLE